MSILNVLSNDKYETMVLRQFFDLTPTFQTLLYISIITQAFYQM